MVSFENVVNSMPPSLLELKVIPSFFFPFRIPDNPTATIIEHNFGNTFGKVLFNKDLQNLVMLSG